MTNEELDKEYDYAWQDFIRTGARLEKMLSGECQKTCSLYQETNGMSCIGCCDYW